MFATVLCNLRAPLFIVQNRLHDWIQLLRAKLGLFKSLVYLIHPKVGLQYKTPSPSKDNCLKLWSTLSLLASDLEKKESLFVRLRNNFVWVFIITTMYLTLQFRGSHGSWMEKNSESQITDIEISFSRITKISKQGTLFNNLLLHSVIWHFGKSSKGHQGKLCYLVVADEGRTGVSLARFPNGKNRGTRKKVIKISFSRITKICK